MKTSKSETIRSFLAIELDQELVPKILDVQKEFKKTNTNIKYVPSKNMHFTLKFFGNIDLDMVEDISDAVNKVIKNYSSFDLNIKKCGCFPNKNVMIPLFKNILIAKIIAIIVPKAIPRIIFEKESATDIQYFSVEASSTSLSKTEIGDGSKICIPTVTEIICQISSQNIMAANFIIGL